MVKSDIVTMAAKKPDAPKGTDVFDHARRADRDYLHCSYGIVGAGYAAVPAKDD